MQTRSEKEHSFFLLLIFPRLKFKRALTDAKKSAKQTKNIPCHACSGNELLRPVSTTSVEKSILFLFYWFFFALASILTARFNRRSIKETKNALFHARSGNGPLGQSFPTFSLSVPFGQFIGLHVPPKFCYVSQKKVLLWISDRFSQFRPKIIVFSKKSLHS